MVKFILPLFLAAGTPAPDGGSRVVVSTGVSKSDWKLLPDCRSDGGNALNFTASSNTFSCGSLTIPGATTPGGSSPQIQYNNSGAFGGMTNYTADGTRPKVIPEFSFPSAPTQDTQLQLGFQPDGGWPMTDLDLDTFWSAVIPRGFYRGGLFSPMSLSGGSGPSWFQACAIPAGWGVTTTYNLIGDTANTPQQTTGGNNSVAWDAGTWRGRQRYIGMSSAGSTNSFAAIRANTQQVNSLGGFVWWSRMYLVIGQTDMRMFVGLAASTNEFTSTVDPSAYLNTVYFGCDSGQTTMRVCTNGGSGTASCTDLGANFPCALNVNSGAGYDFWFAVPPGAGYALYKIDRLDTSQSTNGRLTISPTGIQLNSHVLLNTGSGSTAVRQDWGGWCYWSGW